ncbi:helix-turn-helix transcriptional regulator [Streptomyces sp. NPDC051218]|uniref:helix-turn-helix transcriptional regulator n=1 Tax=Streptomyces sp. NPDC051218 TaxID=3365645 RepID=UPI00378ACABA
MDRLTGRERQVLALLGGGLPTRALASKLGIAERTVKSHITHIIGKLELESRLEAALVANIHHDLICPGAIGGFHG